jgi:glucose/arabinose dehydrogenase
MNRRRFLTAAALTTAGLAGCVGDGGPDGTNSTNGTVSDVPDAVALETLATGLDNPLDIAFVPEKDLRYVAEQPGRIRVHDSQSLRSDPLLDISDSIEAGGEKGLLGIALHPEFAQTRRLFVRYSAPSRAGTPSNYSHTFVLAEFAVTEDGLTARPDSEQTVLEIPEPQGNHNAGDIAFGPDGYLYVAVGDGGAGGDQGRGHPDDWYDAVGGGSGQDVTENLLGSILRLDVDDQTDGMGYAIPDDNPLVGSEGLDEHYAWGFRNPWRLAFDGEDLYVGDVGQNRYEEIARVEKGGNYGWNVTEGSHCYETDDCPDETPADVRGGEQLRDPVIEYPHDGADVSGISVIAGNVYRGDAVSGLQGAYVFADYRAQGQLFVARERETGQWPADVLPIVEDDAGKLSACLSIGRNDGELYVLGNGEQGGGVHRLAAAGGSGPPALDSKLNAPADADGDGLYEDVRGDGTASVLDVQTLFTNLDNPILQTNAAAFKFSGVGDDVTVLDVQALFNQLPSS